MSRLEDVYEALFGSSASKGKLYAGFYTLLGGVFAGLASLVLFIISNGKPEPQIYEWREPALVLGALGAVAIFFGISLALPSKRGMRIASYVGVGICVVATLLFVNHYPLNFNVAAGAAPGQQDYTAIDAGLFVLGLAILVAGMFTSLIGYYVGRTGVVGGPGGGAYDPSYDVGAGGYELSDAVIERDIDYAMKRYGVQWGEGSDKEVSGLNVNVKDDFDGAITIHGKGIARTVQLESPQVDEATMKLKGIRPKAEVAASAQEVDDPTQALLAFRKQKQANPRQYRVRTRWYHRWFGWLIGHPKESPQAGSNGGRRGQKP